MSKAQEVLEELNALDDSPVEEGKEIEKAVNHFLDNFTRLGDGNKAMKGAVNVAVDAGMDADDAFTELASMKKIQDKAKASPWDEKAVKKFIQKRHG